MLWSGVGVLELDESIWGNAEITFPIKKRINAELFIDRMTILFKGETQIRVVTNEGDQSVALADKDTKMVA